jgi:hypothetical protein
MNHAEVPKDDAEVQRLLRERDSLGTDSSLWLRAFRQLIKEGKPIGKLLGLTIPISDDKRMPVGMLNLTDNDRLVFWPVLPRRPCAVLNKPRVKLPDHITVEFPSEKVHVTSYASSGRPIHVRDCWRSAPLQPDIRLLFAFLVRMSVVADQDVLIGRKCPTPSSDRDRRTQEFAKCAARVTLQELPVPGNAAEKHYAYLAFYSVPQLMTAEMLSSSLLPKNAADGMVTGWPDHVEFPIIVGQFTIRQHGFCVAAGFPPGQLNDDLCFGFPQRLTCPSTTGSARPS